MELIFEKKLKRKLLENYQLSVNNQHAQIRKKEHILMLRYRSFLKKMSTRRHSSSFILFGSLIITIVQALQHVSFPSTEHRHYAINRWRRRTGPSTILHPLLKMKLSSLSSSATQSATTAQKNEIESMPSTAVNNDYIKSSQSPYSSSSTTTSKTFDNFDYLSHWYPVAWLRDIPTDKPTKVTIFDVDYVIAKRLRHLSPSSSKNDNNNNNNDASFIVTALIDRCPHKSAALSEGRITSCGNFQCAYHGWSFDGIDGSCTEIPQVERTSSTTTFGSRADATAIPVTISQGMIWLFPGGRDKLDESQSLPPTVPEMDMPGFRYTPVVRDFPVDWTVLIENIMDPDHGLFAHTNVGFDYYTASRDAPQKLEEEFPEGGSGWIISSRVDAVYKLKKINEEQRRQQKKILRGGGGGGKESLSSPPSDKRATSTFYAPTHIQTCRRDVITNGTSFMNAFWICPTGTGRSRFMAAAIGKTPFAVPRWMTHVMLNNFLDQDTYLLATVQRHVLAAERRQEGVLFTEHNNDEKNEGMKRAELLSSPRKSLYVYRSPTERLQTRLSSFFDATLHKVPRRREGLLRLFPEGTSGDASSLSLPSRRTVLDRYDQHTNICQDSADVVRNCQRVKLLTKLVTIVASLVARWWWLSFPTRRRGLKMAVGVLGVMMALVNWGAEKMRREFYFKYTEKYRDEDLKKVPSVWADVC